MHIFIKFIRMYMDSISLGRLDLAVIYASLIKMIQFRISGMEAGKIIVGLMTKIRANLRVFVRSNEPLETENAVNSHSTLISFCIERRYYFHIGKGPTHLNRILPELTETGTITK